MNIWNQVNKNLIAKAIGEMIFEETITYEEHGDVFSFKAKDVIYSFKGQKSLWNWIKVDPDSIRRDDENEIEASHFFIDMQDHTQMDDITLAQFIEESRSTLFADLHLNHEISAGQFIKLNFLESQQILNGHPKILLNKGRLGWSAEDWKSYAPENGPIFPLRVIAIKSDLLTGKKPDPSLYQFLFNKDQLEKITQKVDFNIYTLMPVHPWQWNNVIIYHYQSEIKKQQLIDLGMTSFHYSPQISLRTLNCIENLKAYEIKLPLSILNTSCIRGIPAKTVELGVKVSQALKTLINNDSLLKGKVDILQEVAGINYIAKDLAKVKKAPYRFHEFLGAIWRESAFSKEEENQKIILTANLLFVDKNKRSSVTEYILSSGLSAQEWIREYTKVVIIPLFHLQTQYGVGLVSHGQNIMLVLENFIPKKLILKDFQGDFRLSTQLSPSARELFKDIYDHTTKLPPEHLIHDLYTAHFVTLLRYVGMNLDQDQIISESDFYQTMAQEVSLYEEKFHPSIRLTQQYFEKILINTVRFKNGYGDSAQRPLPLLGTTIHNPLHQVNL